MRLLFFLLFIIVPVIEIYLFIQVGSMIGAGNTILIIIITAIVGAAMLRSQGLQTLARIQESLQQFRLPAREMIEGVLIVIGGAFLLTPGFFTDTIGFLCLIPFTRQSMIRIVIGLSAGLFTAGAEKPFHSSSHRTSQQRASEQSGSVKSFKQRNVIEGEYTNETGKKNDKQ